MNIIKLKDIVMPSEFRLSKFFNENLKGKYAYWIQMRYIFPMNSLDYKTYIKYEQMERVHFLSANVLPHIDLYSEECCMFNFAQNYVDSDATEAANSINEFVINNNYVADFDIDINKLRNFRSWLANEVLMLNTDINGVYTDNLNVNQIHMLEYYKNGKYNDVIKQLNIFGFEGAFTLASPTKSGCCCNNNAVNLYTSTSTTSCNAVDIYTKNLHTLMVQTFEDVNFWMQFNKDFIAVFKKYIDNIIKTGLIINTTDTKAVYTTCTCNNNAINTSNSLLQNLSTALQYIIDDEVTGHLNFIHDSLYNWADQLYDNMSWKL
jgi:hypothetical protein